MVLVVLLVTEGEEGRKGEGGGEREGRGEGGGRKRGERNRYSVDRSCFIVIAPKRNTVRGPVPITDTVRILHFST